MQFEILIAIISSFASIFGIISKFVHQTNDKTTKITIKKRDGQVIEIDPSMEGNIDKLKEALDALTDSKEVANGK